MSNFPFLSNYSYLTLPVTKESIRFCSTIGEIHVSLNTRLGGGKLSGVSFSAVITAEKSPVLEIVYYGEDEDEYLRHISSHLQQALRVCINNQLRIITHHPTCINREKVGEVFGRYFGIRMQLSNIPFQLSLFCCVAVFRGVVGVM